MKADIIHILSQYSSYITILRLSNTTYNPWIGRRFIKGLRYITIIDHYIKFEYNGLYNIYRRFNNNWYIYNTFHDNAIINPNINDDILISYYINGDNIIYVFTYEYRYNDIYHYHIYPDYTIKAYYDIMEINSNVRYNDNLDINRKIYESLHNSNIRYRLDVYTRYKWTSKN